MDEQASFEPQAVLDRGRTGWSRLPVLVPVIALAAIAWAGFSGRWSASNETALIAASATPAATSDPRTAAPPSSAPMIAAYPRQVLGIAVYGLAEATQLSVKPDEEIAVAGWYFTTSITHCPPLAAIYRDGALPELRPDLDAAAFCARSGLLYEAPPVLDDRVPTNNLEDNRAKSAGLPVLPATLATGIAAPAPLDVLGSDALPVVVLGRFVNSNVGCGSPAPCRRGLAVDHVAWADGQDLDQVVGSGAGSTTGLPRLPADGLNVVDGPSATN
jgi:hypothetical protein